MSDEEYVQKPLVYIDQPTIISPKVAMQDTYQTDHSRKKPQETNKSEQPKRKIRLIDQLYMNDHRESNQHKESDPKPVKEETKDTNEKFAHLSIDGKIEYLLNRPQFIPTLTCKINTTEGHYYGKIINFKEDTVSLRLDRSRAVKRIARNTIEDINLIGF